MSNWKFEPTVTLGTILTIIMVGAAVIAGYIRLEASVAEVDRQARMNKDAINLMRSYNETTYVRIDVNNEIMRYLESIDRRLDRIEKRQN